MIRSWIKAVEMERKRLIQYEILMVTPRIQRNGEERLKMAPKFVLWATGWVCGDVVTKIEKEKQQLGGCIYLVLNMCILGNWRTSRWLNTWVCCSEKRSELEITVCGFINIQIAVWIGTNVRYCRALRVVGRDSEERSFQSQGDRGQRKSPLSKRKE